LRVAMIDETMAMVDRTKLAKLRKLKNEQILHQARAVISEACLKAEVIEAMMELNLPADSGVVCLDCGCMRRSRAVPCRCAITIGGDHAVEPDDAG